MKRNLLYITFLIIIFQSCEEDKPDKTVVTPDLDDRQITALAVSNDNVLWIGTDTGLFKSVPGGYELIDIKNEGAVTALGYEENDQYLWVGTKQGLSKISTYGSDPVADTIASDKLSNDSINSVYVTSNSDKWFGTRRGITLNSSENWQKEKFKKNLSGTITAIAFEKTGVNSIGSWDGDFYFATNGQSVYRTFNWDETADAFSGASQLLSPYNGTALSDTMYVVFIDSKGQQWFGGPEGVQVHTGHNPKMDNISFYDELVNPSVHCIAEAPDGEIWVGTKNGISVYDGNSWTPKTASLPDPFVTAIAFDQDGQAWIGTNKGLIGMNP